VLSARDLEAVPDDIGDRAEWEDEETNRNIDHADGRLIGDDLVRIKFATLKRVCV